MARQPGVCEFSESVRGQLVPVSLRLSAGGFGKSIGDCSRKFPSARLPCEQRRLVPSLRSIARPLRRPTRNQSAVLWSLASASLNLRRRVVKAFETKAYRVKFPGGTPGIELAGIVDRPDPEDDRASNSTLPVAIFSHCFTCNKDLKATVRISRSLAHQGVSVLRFDMMGLGGSGGEFSRSNFTTNLADLAAAIRFADRELGPVTALIGHSFGGVASLVTASGATDGFGDVPRGKLGFVGTLAAPSDTQHLASLLSRMSPGIESEGEGTVTIGGVSWKIRKQMLDDFRSHDIPSSLSRIECPVLLMHSPVDETVAYDHALRLMNLMQTDRDPKQATVRPISLVTLDGADHLLLREAADLQFVSNLFAAWCHRHHPK